MIKVDTEYTAYQFKSMIVIDKTARHSWIALSCTSSRTVAGALRKAVDDTALIEAEMAEQILYTEATNPTPFPKLKRHDQPNNYPIIAPEFLFFLINTNSDCMGVEFRQSNVRIFVREICKAQGQMKECQSLARRESESKRN